MVVYHNGFMTERRFNRMYKNPTWKLIREGGDSPGGDDPIGKAEVIARWRSV